MTPRLIHAGAPARLRLLCAGPGVTIQDEGRRGYLRYGVTEAGPMDWTAFRTANLALGNESHAAAIEISLGGLRAICENGPLWIAYAGADFNWRRDGALLPPAARLLLQPGDSLTVRPGAMGAWTYLAVEGGFDTEPELGSRATHTRSSMGGVDGRMLREGDILPAAAPGSGGDRSEAIIDAAWLRRTRDPIRVVPGPQDDYFDPSSLAAFFDEEFTLTPAADRMAYRFEGPEIAHSRGYNIVSDGVALGAIQVAGDRRPLILMADRQPTGGYPKLGHVIRADIGRLAQSRPGERRRFAQVSTVEARTALLALEDEIAGIASHMAPLRREPTSKLLLETNLIDGFTDALTDLASR
ncbi:biotin-dependent carboxyltransferase family protein [Methylocapsa palsarum]|uniref:Biotin-dependent carboxylase uncharacterized domain-containing protein n=1 Tax=Methylocapsa palsarum TaxID=1612308 RepID=A0A1I3ZVH9_9HYPH|nr:biotin-dependent carboxyltransferase family protein [Methylocapsa palsarum]SFK48164.1 biotin-dependent carboxylase uncharacterized domain-containing protein [Methylocapsa palsarum]